MADEQKDAKPVAARPALDSSSPLARWLARWRVPLGFVAAALVLWLARPTPASLLLGATVAAAGEAFRLWAAGHLEKSREVTTSGPYRFTRHPLYVGSSVIGAGIAIAAAQAAVAACVALYLAATISSAIRTEEAFLRARFGDAYDAYAGGAAHAGARRFSLSRAVRNKEYRAVAGLTAGFTLLFLRAWWR
jgi:protein-S-isoprenylcysteine O-methyltransferase Ste14